MKVVNPLGRTPTTHEVAAMDCHCVCNVQMDDHGWNWAGEFHSFFSQFQLIVVKEP